MSNPLSLDCTSTVTIAQTSGSDGYPLSYRVWRPLSPSRATVVLLNGIMSHSGWFFPLVDPLVATGLTVLGADRRGSGLNTQARGDAPTAKAVIEDALAVIDAECPPEQPIILVGWCWGTVLALNLVRPLGDRLAGFVMVAPGLFPSVAVSQAATRHEAAAAGSPQDTPCIATPIVETMFTTGPYLDGFIRRDDARIMTITPRFRGLMTKLSMGALARLRRLSAPLLLLLAEADEATDNAAVLDALAGFSPQQLTTKTTVSGHAMQFDAPQFVTSEIVAFAGRLALGDATPTV